MSETEKKIVVPQSKQALHKPPVQFRQIGGFQVRPFFSATIAGGSPAILCEVDFVPDYWWVVAHLTAGSLIVYPGNAPTRTQFRLVNNAMRLPINNSALYLLAQTATGMVEAYAVVGEGFQVI